MNLLHKKKVSGYTVDVNDHPYKELVEAAKATNKRLYEVHSGKIMPFSQMPKASDAGTPSSPWKK